MTQAFSDMLYLFSCSAHGTSPEARKDLDLDAIFQKATEHGVLPLVIMSVMNLNTDRECIILGKTLDNHIRRLRSQILKDIQRSIIIHSAIRKLTSENISFCILKGATIANLYKYPECRISNDTDIYIDGMRATKNALKVLKPLGFEYRGNPPGEHHLRVYHELAGEVELHHRLFRRDSLSRHFGSEVSQLEPYRIVKSPYGYEFPALGISDGLKYNYLHITKHFVNRGVGIRPLMDLLLYIRENKNAIDYNQFYNVISELKYEKFFDSIICIGIKYLGFSAEDLYPCNCDEGTIEELLSDIEEGGMFGGNLAWRAGFSKVYNEQRINKHKEEARDEYMKKWTKNPAKRFFMNRYSIAKEYPYVNRYRTLLPIAWLHRAVRFTISLLTGKRKSNIHTDIINARMKLINKLDMI